MSDGARYLLSGFGPGLDWVWTTFVEDFPRVHVCGVCGVVPKKIALLPCCHPHCGYCLKECVTRGNTCLLDGNRFKEHLINWVAFTDEQIAQLKVRCRRGGRHCDFVGPLVSHIEHEEECGFHIVKCPSCQHEASRKYIINHIGRCPSRTKKETSEYQTLCSIQ